MAEAAERPAPASTVADTSLAGRGRELFRKWFTHEEGLGPEFNAKSCASCHQTPVEGGSGTGPDSFVAWSYDGPSDAIGRPQQRFTLGATDVITAAWHGGARRRTPALFGIGYLEGVALEALRLRHDPTDADADGVSGRLAWRDECVGRFGWQSSTCDVATFVRTALHHELGIETLPRSRREISEVDVASLTAFVRELRPPSTPASDEGVEVFEKALCATCHASVTGTATVAGIPVAVRAYTDLLLHEMGAGPRHREQDSRTEFRTPPLWGIRAAGPPYLHDGSAATLEQAILRHAGEAERSVRRYSALGAVERDRLLRFVRTR